MTARTSIKIAFAFIAGAIILNTTKWWEILWELAQSVAWLLVFIVIGNRFLHYYKQDFTDKVYLAMASGLLAFQSLTIIDETYSAFIKYKYYSLPAPLYYAKIDEGFDLYNGFYWLVLGCVWLFVFIVILCGLNWNGSKWNVE